jgi:hypothetical protein
MPSSPPLLRAYVDETGDRGHSAKSSPFFAFAAVLVSDEDEPTLRTTMSRLRRSLQTPVGKALHWKDHVKTHQRRQYVATQLAAVPGLMITYVIVEKSAIPVGSGMYLDHELFYNYAAGIVVERLLLAVVIGPMAAGTSSSASGMSEASTTQRRRSTLRTKPRQHHGSHGSGFMAASSSVIRLAGTDSKRPISTPECLTSLSQPTSSAATRRDT